MRGLEELRQITKVAYQHAQHQYAKILAEEAMLRAELERLRALAQATRTKASDDIALAAIGGDILWQGWLSRSRAAQNMALARVLAVKEQHLRDVRKAYGKLLVAEELLKTAEKDAVAKDRQKQLEQAIDAAVLPARYQ